MTNPQGYMFISYRSTQLPVVLRLRRKLEEYGIPVWHDKDSMPPGMLEKGMTDAIRNENCAGAVVWLSKDMASSAAIQRIELPEILRRVQRADEFVLVFCLADGLTFDDAQTILSPNYASFNIKSFLAQTIRSPLHEEADIEVLARLVLEKRVQLIHSGLAKEGALTIYIAGHSAPPATTGYALVMDHHLLFTGRFSTEDLWKSRILPALDLMVGSIVRYAPGRSVVIQGTPQLSLALALGYAMKTPKGLKARWSQMNPDSTLQGWNMESKLVPHNFIIERSTDLLNGQDIAVLIGVTQDPKPTFDASSELLPRFGALIRVLPKDNLFPARIATGSEASSLTQEVIRELRSTIRECRLQGSLHIFVAGPAGLAFLLGQQLNTCGKVYCYEHESSGPIGVYRPNLAINT